MADYDVFVSYGKGDGDFVRSLVDSLETRGVRVWYDGGEIRVGENFMRRIEEALEQSLCFLPVISPDYLSGQWAPFELGVALGAESSRGAHVIPVLVRGAEASSLPAPLKNKKYQILNATKVPATVVAIIVAEFVNNAKKLRNSSNLTGRLGLPTTGSVLKTTRLSSDSKS